MCKCVDVDVDVSLCRPVLKHRPTQRHIYVYIYTLHTAQKTSRSMKKLSIIIRKIQCLTSQAQGSGVMLIFSVAFQF